MMSSKSNDKELQTSNSVSCEGNDKELKASNTVSSKKDDKILEPSILEMNEMETESLQDYCVYEANEISEILQMMSTGSDGQELKPSSQDVKEMEPKGLQDCYRDKDNFEIVEMNSEIAVKKKEPEGLEVQNKVEPRCPEDHHRYETFTVEEMMKQMENAATFDWEDDVNDPFEKAVARSGEANREPDAQKEHSRTYRGDDKGQSNSCRLQDHIPEAGSFQDRKPQNRSVLHSQGHSRSNRGDDQGQSNSHRLQDHIPEIGYCQDCELENRSDLLSQEHSRTYRGDDQGQSNGHKLQDHIPEVGSFEDCEPQNKSVLLSQGHSRTSRDDQGQSNGLRLQSHIPEVGSFQDREPQNKSVFLSQEHSRTYKGDDQGQINSHRLQNLIPEIGSFRDHEPQNENFDVSQRHSRTYRDDQGQINSHRLQDIIPEIGSFQDHEPQNISLLHSQGHSRIYKRDGQDQSNSDRLQDHIPKVGYCQDCEQLNESADVSQGHCKTYGGDAQGQSNGQRLQDHIPEVRYCQDREPQNKSDNVHATDSSNYMEDLYRRHDRSYSSSPSRGYKRGNGQQPQRRSNDSYEKYSPRDVSNSRKESNRYCDMDFRVFRGGSYKRQHSKSSTVSLSRGYNRGTWQQPHRFSDINYEKHSPRGISDMQSISIKPWLLVEALAECPDFKATLLQLLEWKNMQPSAVREVVLSNGHVFEINGEVVELHPKISICKAHSGPQGCQNPSLCTELHICDTHVASWCQENNCEFGHRWYTEHNKTVLRDFYLERLPPQSLKNLIKGFTTVTGATGQLDVCRDYNGKGCSKRYCDSLHVCRSIVVGLTKCVIPGCKLNHNLLTPDCCKLLRAHGFSTNEAPRDVAVALLAAYPALISGGPGKQVAPATPPTQAASTTGQARKTPTTVDKQQDAGGAGNSRMGGGFFSWFAQKTASDASEMQMSLGASAVRSRHSADNNRNTNSSKSKDGSVPNRNNGTDKSAGINKMNDKKSSSSKTTSGRKNEKRKTVWSHYLCGDTEVDQICFQSVESSCKYEESGCRRLHAAQHFHWQISEQGDSWLNLRSFQVNCLERSFCNPAEDGVVMPRLDPAKLNPSVHHLLTVLGQDTWHANFQAMILNNSDYSRILYLRRLCTEFIAGHKIKASTYQWFFMDKNQKWVRYGKVDTAGETKLVSSVTSDDIEKHFLRSQDTPLTFKNASYTYVVDFHTMTQLNQTTNVKREVRRRAEPHFKDANQARGMKAPINKNRSH